MEKKDLSKLVEFINELARMPGNEWFMAELGNRLVSGNTSNVASKHLDEIYEYCIQKIIEDHAAKFYFDFKDISRFLFS
jgi:hypothetical protein